MYHSNKPHSFLLQELSLGYVNEKNGETHFVSVGTDEDKEFESADTFYFTYDGEDIPAGSVSNILLCYFSTSGECFDKQIILRSRSA